MIVSFKREGFLFCFSSPHLFVCCPSSYFRSAARLRAVRSSLSSWKLVQPVKFVLQRQHGASLWIRGGRPAYRSPRAVVPQDGEGRSESIILCSGHTAAAQRSFFLPRSVRFSTRQLQGGGKYVDCAKYKVYCCCCVAGYKVIKPDDRRRAAGEQQLRSERRISYSVQWCDSSSRRRRHTADDSSCTRGRVLMFTYFYDVNTFTCICTGLSLMEKVFFFLRPPAAPTDSITRCYSNR